MQKVFVADFAYIALRHFDEEYISVQLLENEEL